MKKNLISVIVLTLVLANLILTAMLVFTIVPQSKKSNALIDEICMAIDLELEGGQNKKLADIPIEDIEVYNIAETFTVTLKNSDETGDGGKKAHYAVFTVGLSLNMKSEGYKTYKGSEGLAEKETLIRDEINDIVGKFTLEEFKQDQQKYVKEQILSSMQAMFGGSDFIIGVNFSSVNAE